MSAARNVIALAATLVLATACTASPTAAMPRTAPTPATQHPVQLFEVSLDTKVPGPVSGRLLVVTMPWADANRNGKTPSMLAAAPDDPIAAQELDYLASGGSTYIDADAKAYPAPLSKAPPGDYAVQAILDVNHDYAYGGPGPGDIVSPVYRVHLPGGIPQLVLDAVTPQPVATERPLQQSADAAAKSDAFEKHLDDIDFVSPALSAFWGRPMHIRAWVLTPPGYETSKETYPAVYRAEGFGGTHARARRPALNHWNMMLSGETPPMIRVFLDHSTPWGTTEFADSVNNGPWGKALTEELIPYLESKYRMDAKPSGRFVTGHSSGGWFAMWQQVRYPKVYGGTWARAPDPVDFHSFTGIDIYRPGANAYTRPDGSSQYLMRNAKGEEIVSFRQYSQREEVEGDYGGQIDSFDWVFSPRADDGRPQPLFDRHTGVIDPSVAAYWRENYDIAAIIQRDWKTLKPDLDGKIHLIVGTVDTFHLNEAAELLQHELDDLGAKSSFTFMPGRTHGTLDRIGCDPQGLEKKIAWEMWAMARPGSKLAPKPAPKCAAN
ncbi:MAG: enterochelin esterase [Alphaproteobacteria bacterium]|nr:enterochelin esterase [Alphaproteobacteria bacterium]